MYMCTYKEEPQEVKVLTASQKTAKMNNEVSGPSSFVGLSSHVPPYAGLAVLPLAAQRSQKSIRQTSQRLSKEPDVHGRFQKRGDANQEPVS